MLVVNLFQCKTWLVHFLLWQAAKPSGDKCTPLMYQRYGCKYSKNGSLEQVNRHEKTKQTLIIAQKKGLADIA